MRTRHKTFVIAAALAAASAASTAHADTIDIAGFWAGWGTATINFSGTNYHDNSFTTLSEYGGSGGFKTYDLTTDPGMARSFQSFCVDIFHSFSFPAVGTANSVSAASIFGATKANDLGRLYTNHHASIDATNSTADSEAAFQLAVWEIVNEKANTPYNLANGNFWATGTGSATAGLWLNELNTTASSSAYSVNIWAMQQGPSGYGPQDVAVFAPVPEPEIYAMLIAGFGLMGFWRRRTAPSMA